VTAAATTVIPRWETQNNGKAKGKGKEKGKGKSKSSGKTRAQCKGKPIQAADQTELPEASWTPPRYPSPDSEDTNEAPRRRRVKDAEAKEAVLAASPWRKKPLP
jgi:hypothetical protein